MKNKKNSANRHVAVNFQLLKRYSFLLLIALQLMSCGDNKIETAVNTIVMEKITTGIEKMNNPAAAALLSTVEISDVEVMDFYDFKIETPSLKEYCLSKNINGIRMYVVNFSLDMQTMDESLNSLMFVMTDTGELIEDNKELGSALNGIERDSDFMMFISKLDNNKDIGQKFM